LLIRDDTSGEFGPGQCPMASCEMVSTAAIDDPVGTQNDMI